MRQHKKNDFISCIVDSRRMFYFILCKKFEGKKTLIKRNCRQFLLGAIFFHDYLATKVNFLFDLIANILKTTPSSVKQMMS